MYGWVETEYNGNPMADTYIALVEDGEPGVMDWIPAFYEDGKLMVRARAAGSFWLWTKIDGRTEQVKTVTVS